MSEFMRRGADELGAFMGSKDYQEQFKPLVLSPEAQVKPIESAFVDATPRVELKILDPRIGDTFPMPCYKTDGSAGMDLVACIDKPLKLAANQTEMVSSGIAIHIANPGYVALLYPRSGRGSKGLVLGNLTGVIDSDYQGLIKICLWNRTDGEITVNPGDAVAQLLVMPVQQVSFEVVQEFSGDSDRGIGGFGSTGN